MAIAGNVPIPPNDYWVSLNAETAEITLSASGKDIRIKATRRKMATKSKTTIVHFHSGGGKTWSIIVVTPKQGEWVAFIDYQ